MNTLIINYYKHFKTTFPKYCNYSEETGFRCIAEGLGCKNVIAEFSNFLKVILWSDSVLQSSRVIFKFLIKPDFMLEYNNHANNYL